MDYGHPLAFGVLLAPTAADPSAAVELARLAEELGFDLVAVADRPHRADLLDAWTALSWVAARTARVRLAAGALRLAARPPAVLARAAASLDLLASGRVELALGAEPARPGPADEAATAGQALAAARLWRAGDDGPESLDEAVDVLLGIWAAADDGPLRYAGDHFRIPGAARGPAPAHTIPLWLGGADPGVLRVVAEKADGWLARLGDQPGALPLAQLAAANALVDSLAAGAGRDPREIRRAAVVPGQFTAAAEGFLAGPPKQWADDLLGLALEHGVSTVVLAPAADGTADGDAEAATLRAFAAEVIPALRDALAGERTARGTREGVPVPRHVRARRRPGIDYDAVPASLATAAVEPGDAAYAAVRSTYMRGGAPGLVLRPGSAAEVAEALRFARAQPVTTRASAAGPVRLSVRSGGHGVSGRSTNDGGIVVDVSRLNTVEVLDQATRRVRIGPGARWRDVAAALGPHGWALTSGDYGGVGVGGLATAGGIGWLARAHGLTIDHLRAVDLVLADGSAVRADSAQNPDLFWAARGAGANFGVATAFEFEAAEVGDVAFGQFVFDASDTAGFLRRLGEIVEAAPRDLTTNVILGPPRRGQPVIAQVMAVVASDDPDTVLDRLRPLAAMAPLLDHVIQILPYPAIMDAPQGPHEGQGEPVARSALAEHLTPALAEAAARMIWAGETYFFQIRSVGGAVADVAADATAYAHRAANFSVVAFGASRARLDRAWDALPDVRGLYLSFDSDPRPERVADAFPPDTLRRLRALKRRYDPDNVFRDNFNIAPADPPGGS